MDPIRFRLRIFFILLLGVVLVGTAGFMAIAGFSLSDAFYFRMEKLNMVIGLFFSEVGTGLLAYFSQSDPNLEILQRELIIRSDWSDRDFLGLEKRVEKHDYTVDITKTDLEGLRS